MGNKIAHELISNSFLPVLGTIEECSNGSMVTIGRVLSWDENNGLMVVYDGQGQPWIRSRKFIDREFRNQLVRKYKLRLGADVPHSNDGGSFVSRVLTETGVSI